MLKLCTSKNTGNGDSSMSCQGSVLVQNTSEKRYREGEREWDRDRGLWAIGSEVKIKK